MQSSWRVPWRAVQHAIYTTVSGDTHLSISRWIIEGTPPPPCFLHRLELVVAPEYKDHVALEVRGANLFKFLFPHVVFLVIPPLLYFSSPPMNQLLSLGTLLPPWRLFSKGFSPRTQLNRNFHAPAHRHTFHFLVSYYSLISLFFCIGSFFWLSCKIYLLSLMNKNKSIITCTAAKACPSTCLSCKDQYASLLLHAQHIWRLHHVPTHLQPLFFILLIRKQGFTMQE